MQRCRTTTRTLAQARAFAGARDRTAGFALWNSATGFALQNRAASLALFLIVVVVLSFLFLLALDLIVDLAALGATLLGHGRSSSQ
jgi:hypothetical protein